PAVDPWGRERAHGERVVVRWQRGNRRLGRRLDRWAGQRGKQKNRRHDGRRMIGRSGGGNLPYDVWTASGREQVPGTAPRYPDWHGCRAAIASTSSWVKSTAANPTLPRRKQLKKISLSITKRMSPP